MADLGPIGNSVLLVLSAGSLAVWLYVLWTACNRRAPLIRAPQEPVSWQALPVFATFLLALVVPDFVIRLGGAGDRFSLHAVQWRALAMALQGLAVVSVLRIAGPLRPHDFGWNPASWRGDLAAGAAGFLASLIPVAYVNLAVEKLELRGEDDKHLFFKILEADSSDTILFWIALSVVVLAPLAEELTYRVLLQGWCQSQFSPWMAIPFSATIFSLVHRSPDCFPLFPLALILGYVYYRRRSYLAVVLIHSLFNATNLAFAVLTKS
jgi:membrane protease YdiL (CAAX protease family)